MGFLQAVRFVLLLSRQGKVRLSKWYTTYNQKERAKIIRDITPLVLGRALKLCNFLDYQDIKVSLCIKIHPNNHPSVFSETCLTAGTLQTEERCSHVTLSYIRTWQECIAQCLLEEC